MSRVRGHFCAHRLGVRWKAAGSDENANADCAVSNSRGPRRPDLGATDPRVRCGCNPIEPCVPGEAVVGNLHCSRRTRSTFDFLGVRCNVDWTPQDCFAFAASISSTFSVGTSRKDEPTPPATRTRRGSRRDFDLLARRSTREHGQTQRRT